MKIAVYTAIKNEIDNIDQWYQSCCEADIICVADTGSTDGTLEKIKSLPKIKITETEIIPWRFDDAFNIALYSIPSDTDTCIRLDLDERLQPGWRTVLENVWVNGINRLRYPYIWNWNPDGSPGRQWYGDRIHSRKNYRWVGPTHEYLMCRSKENLIWTNDLKIYQYPKAKSKNDLSLLIEFVNEYPHDDRALAYLGRELHYLKKYPEAAAVLKKYLDRSKNNIERGQSYWILAECEPENTLKYLLLSQQELPDFREPLIKISQYYYLRNEWNPCLEYAIKALDITNHPMSYICEEDAWGWQPYDLAAIASWNLEKYQDALRYGQQAVLKHPNDERLKSNLEFYQRMITQSK